MIRIPALPCHLKKELKTGIETAYVKEPNNKKVGSSGNLSNFYSGGARFEPPMEHRISGKGRAIAQASQRSIPHQVFWDLWLTK
jgi:hypothetical protein